MGGEDQTNSLQQIVRFGLNDDMAVGGALFELESILKVPDAARIGWWTMEWWWDQPELAAGQSIRRRHAPPHRQGGERPQLVRLCGGPRAGAGRKSGEIPRRGRCSPARCRTTRCRPTSRSIPDRAFFRDRDHELMSTILVGEVHPPRGDPFDVFTARAACRAEQAAEPAEASACQTAFPS